MRLALLAAVLIGATSASAQPPTKRALLVGINTYADPEAAGAGARPWRDLRGPVNDVRMIREVLVNHAGFADADVDTLVEGAATRAGILAALGRLVESARPGDQLVFYYAGHGSRVRNTASDESDGMDEALVPSDAAPRPDGSPGAPFIRDKELRRLFNVGIANVTAGGADGLVTIILDSCHSGSGTRGFPEPGLSRQVDPDPSQSVSDAAVLQAPETLPGTLVLSAAQDDEPAIETPDGSRYSGGFTRAFVQAVLSTPPGAPARTVFERTSALVAAAGLRQVPTIAGTAVDRPLFGAAPDASGVAGAFSAIQVEPDSARVLLQGGVFQGLGPGALLTRVVAVQAGAPPVRLRVTSTDNVARSRAEAVEGDLATVSPSDLFRLDRWASPPVRPLRLWVPPALDAALVQAAAAEFGAACDAACRTSDPLRDVARKTIAYADGGWTALTGSGPSPPAAGPAAALRAGPPAAPSYLTLPPTAAVATALAAALADYGGVEATADRTAADYWLDGRLRPDGTPEYRWLLPAATARDGQPAPFTSLLASTNWTASAATLATDAFRVGRVHGWLSLASPSTLEFPLRIAGIVRNDPASRAARRLPADSLGVVTVAEHSPPGCSAGTSRGPCYTVAVEFAQADIDAYNAYLNARAAQTGPLANRRHTYLFIVDSEGASTLVWVGGLRPAGAPDTTGSDYRITVPETARTFDTPPFGLLGAHGRHTFILLTTETPIPDPRSAFVTEAIALRARGESRGPGDPANPLADLLDGIGGASRAGDTAVVPTTWSIDRLTVDLLPAP